MATMALYAPREWIRTGGPKKVVKDWWAALVEILHAACPPHAFRDYMEAREKYYTDDSNRR